MAEQKTKKTGESVEAFLDAVPDVQKRADSNCLLKMMQEITGEAPQMWGPSLIGFGDYRYVYDSGHTGDWFVVGFSPRKTAISVYLTCGLTEQFSSQLERLGQFKTGVGCLYVKKLADIDQAVLREIIQISAKSLAKTLKDKAKANKKGPG
jgi:hypothetical protein